VEGEKNLQKKKGKKEKRDIWKNVHNDKIFIPAWIETIRRKKAKRREHWGG